MFKNFKAIAHMKTPIATIDHIILDGIISAAKAKEVLGEQFYTGENIAGTEEMIRGMLDPILDRKHGVYCTSIGIGDNREYVGSWAKRWEDKHEDIVKFRGKGKQRIDIGSGHYKNYHMPLVIKSYKTITFYVRGDMEETKRLLENYIFYLGKKGSQGYGQIRKWGFNETDEDWSVWKDGKPMRPIPAKEYAGNLEALTKTIGAVNIRRHPVIPPYWRPETEMCVMPDERRELDTDHGYFVCQVCGFTVGYCEEYKDHRYCMNCGQKIDWSDGNK